jgi:hypothetical protein
MDLSRDVRENARECIRYVPEEGSWHAIEEHFTILNLE